MAEAPIARLMRRVPLDGRKLSTFTAFVMAGLSTTGCGAGNSSSQFRPKQKSGKLDVYLACPPNTRAQIAETVQPDKHSKTGKAVVGLTCESSVTGPTQPVNMDIRGAQPIHEKDGHPIELPPAFTLSGINPKNVTEFVLNYTYTGAKSDITISAPSPEGSTADGFITMTHVDSIDLELAGLIPKSA